MKQIQLISLLLLAMISFYGNTQILQSTNFIKGGIADAEKIIGAYVLPIEKGIGINDAQSNLHLYETESSNKVNFGFSVNLSSSFVSNAYKTYNLNELGLVKFQASDPNQTIAQTISGSENTIYIESKETYTALTTTFPFSEQRPILKLESPEGVGITAVPFARMSFFVEKNGNYLNFKLLPKVKFSENKIDVYAIGGDAQLNFASVFSKMKSWPIHFYLLAGYNFNRTRYYLDVKPDESYLTFSNPIDQKDYENQLFQITTYVVPLQLSIVKPFKKISLALNGGYNYIYTSGRLIGNFPVYKRDPSSSFNVVVDNFVDPINYKKFLNEFFVGAGASYRLEHFNLSLNYNYSKFQNLNLSIAYLF